MAPGRKPGWLWQHYKKLGKGHAKCIKCGKTYIYNDHCLMKIHLGEKHEIFNEEEEIQWIEREETNQSIWKHFKKQLSYSADCNICSRKGIDLTIKHAYNLRNTRSHLENKHPEVLAEERQEPVSEENDATTSSYQADTHSYVAENLKDKMASGKKLSWVWQHFNELENGNIQCKGCPKTYVSTNYYLMKTHLGEKHQIFNEDEETQWIEREEKNQSIWKHFTKGRSYVAVCNICSREDIFLTIRHAYDLQQMRRHLENKHPEVLTEDRQEPVSEENDASTSSYQADIDSYIEENLEEQDLFSFLDQ